MFHNALTAFCLSAGIVVGSQQALAGPALVGVAAPLSGQMELLGDQIRAGTLGAAAIARRDADVIVADDKCTMEGGVQSANRFVAAEVKIVVGFLCSESIEAALPILTDAGIPVITPGVRADSLTDRRAKTGWLIYRTAPRASEEQAAVASILTRLWARELFAIVDDGTIYGRELAESLRLAAEQSGLKPVYTDTFRPQFDNQIGLAGRLRKAGATHVFAGGDRHDIAIIGRDAAVIGYSTIIAGGEALRAPKGDVDLAPGTLMIAPPQWNEIASASFKQFYAEAGIVPEGYVLAAFAAMEIALAVLGEDEPDDTALTERLDNMTFKTTAGEIRFDETGEKVGNPYRLYRYDGTGFVEVKE